MRYIDADKLVEMYERSAEDDWNKKTAPSSWAEAFECAIADIDDQPTADVVPKSEEGAECPTCHGYRKQSEGEWENLPLDVHEALKQRAVDKAKADVAREIFEEVEREINAALDSNYKVLPRIELSEELWERVRGKIDALRGMDGFIAELKNKYTEEQI